MLGSGKPDLRVPLGSTSSGRSRPIVVGTIASGHVALPRIIPDNPGSGRIRSTLATLQVVGSTSTSSVLRASYAADAARFDATVATIPGSSPVMVTIGTLASTEAMCRYNVL